MSGWHRFDPQAARLTLQIHARPGARVTAVAGLHGDALKIHVAAPPVDDRANAALLAWLAGVLELPQAAVRLRAGAKSRRKIVEIRPADAEIAARAAALAAATGQPDF
ncbi:MAG: DUF167 domain-containing protein [Burkholderiales bacterium]|nr:DUF167 domain-containing protein [Burkholderiales bacterium]